MNASHPLSPRPPHVPADAVFEFDIFDQRLLQDPHNAALQLLTEAPQLFWTPCNGGHWVTTSYEQAFTVLRTPEQFSSGMVSPEEMSKLEAMIPADGPRIPRPVPIMLDPPEHTRYRQPLQKVFAPKTINALKGDIEQLAHQLIDAIIADGHSDFITAVGEQLPVQVFLKMMGLPLERLPEFRELVREVFAPAGANPHDQLLRLRNIADVMTDIILQRREHPGDDLISRLWELELDGEPMTFELMEDYCVLLFLAGLDTVVNAIGFGIRHMALYPDFQQQLRADPQLIPEATEELLRRYTMTIPIRRVLTPLQLADRQLAVNDKIMTYLPLADLDPAEFPEPQLFDLLRENKRHMAFGMGPHRCLGSHLARLELQTLYRVVLERLPEFRLDAARPAQFHAGQMLAVASLPLRWD